MKLSKFERDQIIITFIRKGLRESGTLLVVKRYFQMKIYCSTKLQLASANREFLQIWTKIIDSSSSRLLDGSSKDNAKLAKVPRLIISHCRVNKHLSSSRIKKKQKKKGTLLIGGARATAYLDFEKFCFLNIIWDDTLRPSSRSFSKNHINSLGIGCQKDEQRSDKKKFAIFNARRYKFLIPLLQVMNFEIY